jgi:hypothetical protein
MPTILKNRYQPLSFQLTKMRRGSIYAKVTLAVFAAAVVIASLPLISYFVNYVNVANSIDKTKNTFSYDTSGEELSAFPFVPIITLAFLFGFIMLMFCLTGKGYTRSDIIGVPIIITVGSAAVLLFFFGGIGSLDSPSQNKLTWIQEQTNSSLVKEVTTYDERNNHNDNIEVYITDTNTSYEVVKTEENGRTIFTMTKMSETPELVKIDNIIYIKE